LTSGFALAALAFLPAGSEGLLSEKFLFSALAVIVALVSATISFLLVLAALGRFCTGGSLSRFFRYQLAALGAGGGLGLGFAPAVREGRRVGCASGRAAALGRSAGPRRAFRSARYRSPERRPPAGSGLAEGRVVDYSSGPQARAPSLGVGHFIDAQGRERW